MLGLLERVISVPVVETLEGSVIAIYDCIPIVYKGFTLSKIACFWQFFLKQVIVNEVFIDYDL